MFLLSHLRTFFTSAFSRQICILGVTIFMQANPRALAWVSGQELHDVAAAEYDCGLASGMRRLQRPRPFPPSRHENPSGKKQCTNRNEIGRDSSHKGISGARITEKIMNSQAQGKTYGNKCE